MLALLKKIKKSYDVLGSKLYDMFKNRKINSFALIVFGIFVFGLFYYITKATPLAGDDWGYAINGTKGNPFMTAISFYQTWSGRFFSELWGFLVAPNKGLWNVLNPLFFLAIFLCTTFLSSSQRTYISSGLLILVLMLRVSNNLRMETYTWIMGTTYVIPLMLSLIYFLIIEKKVIFKKENKLGWYTYLSSAIVFYIGLTMENIAAAIIGALIIMLIYYFYYHHSFNKNLLVNLFFSSISLLIMRLSPGSQARLLRDHAIWNQQGIFTKIVDNMPAFIRYTFIDNRYVVFALTLVLIALLYKRVLKNRNVKTIGGSIMMLGYLLTVIAVIGANKLATTFNLSFMNVFLELNNPLVWLFWLVYVVVVLFLVYKLIDNIKSRQKIFFYIIVGGAANVVMLLSPIFGSRSSLYFVYFLIITIVLLFNELKLSDGNVILVLSLILFIFICQSANDYRLRYDKVRQIQKERLAIIQYYKDNPDIDEIHIPRMPVDSIHSADVEVGDDYHFDTFKMYYGLNPNAVVIFEWKDSYN